MKKEGETRNGVQSNRFEGTFRDSSSSFSVREDDSSSMSSFSSSVSSRRGSSSSKGSSASPSAFSIETRETGERSRDYSTFYPFVSRTDTSQELFSSSQYSSTTSRRNSYYDMNGRLDWGKVIDNEFEKEKGRKTEGN